MGTLRIGLSRVTGVGSVGKFHNVLVNFFERPQFANFCGHRVVYCSTLYPLTTPPVLRALLMLPPDVPIVSAASETDLNLSVSLGFTIESKTVSISLF